MHSKNAEVASPPVMAPLKFICPRSGCNRPSLGRYLCAHHAKLDRVRRRRSSQSRPWRAGKRGRPPLSHSTRVSSVGIKAE